MKSILIGITCNALCTVGDATLAGIGTKEQAWQLLAQDYLEAIWKAGGIPIMLPIDHNISRAKTLLNVVNGVLFSGGNDLSPSFYDERTNDCGILDMKRDKMEMALFNEAVSLNKPILGICRGIQLINVALGGKLHQDLSKDGYPKHSIFSSSRNIATHKIVIERNTLLSNIIGCGEHWVNSFHHQGIKELGKGLICAAKSEEGLIEAIEYPQKKFLMAVQWHPEMMYDDDTQQNIFKYFVDACRKEEL